MRPPGSDPLPVDVINGWLLALMKSIAENAQAAVRVDKELGEWFRMTVGTRQGNPISSTTFIIYLERIMDVIRDREVRIQGRNINNLKFVDDIDMIEENRNKLQENMNEVRKAGEAAGLKIKVGKTKTMVTGKENIKEQIELEDIKIENVTEFTNLGSLLTYNNNCSKEIGRRIGRAIGVMAEFKNIWQSKNICIKTKRDIIITCVISVELYACETWTLKKKDKKKTRKRQN